MLLACAALIQGCPGAGGRCAVDQDCATGAAGSFCAAGICEGPIRAVLTSAPSGVHARSETVPVGVQVTRVHGGVESALVSVIAGTSTIAATPDGTGGYQANLPLSFAPPGADAAASFTVRVADSLGHRLDLAGSVHVDDQGPSITIDPATLPAAPSVRNTSVPFVVALSDSAPPLQVQALSDGGPAIAGTVLGNDRFTLTIDTSRAAADATTSTVEIVARDALGNVSHAQVKVPITRVRWRTAAGVGAIEGLVLHENAVVTIGDTGLAVGTRTTGSFNAFPGVGNSLTTPSTDGTTLFTTDASGNACALSTSGAMAWCCPIGVPRGALALAPLPTRSDPLRLLLATDTSSTAGRLYELDSGKTNCNPQATLPLGAFTLGSPVVASNGLVIAAAHDRLASAWFDGLAWATRTDPLDTVPTGFAPGLVHAQATSTTAAGQTVVVSLTSGDLLSLTLPPLGSDGLPSGTTSTNFRTKVVGASSEFAGPPLLASDGAILSATTDRLLVALEADGHLRWSITLPGAVRAPPTLGAGGHVYIVTDDGSLSTYALSDGALEWRVDLGSSSPSSPQLGCDGALYVGLRSGEVVSLAVDAAGFDDGPWPRQGHDAHASADARRPLRASDGSCVEALSP
ncbi:MAG: PQQ-binding-like beta-propeller repeat protein [Deltaproteobacteria bacterium]|nr:PQQ-binding-like beta-propeller repeat protein [Deltaproteobacteria bacterium]